MNIYDVIVEGYIKAFNKKRKNAITDKLGKAVKSEDYNMAGSSRGNRSVGRAVLSSPESSTSKAAVRKVRNRGLPESLYNEVYNIICEGLVKAANKAKKK